MTHYPQFGTSDLEGYTNNLSITSPLTSDLHFRNSITPTPPPVQTSIDCNLSLLASYTPPLTNHITNVANLSPWPAALATPSSVGTQPCTPAMSQTWATNSVNNGLQIITPPYTAFDHPFATPTRPLPQVPQIQTNVTHDSAYSILSPQNVALPNSPFDPNLQHNFQNMMSPGGLFTPVQTVAPMSSIPSTPLGRRPRSRTDSGVKLAQPPKKKARSGKPGAKVSLMEEEILRDMLGPDGKAAKPWKDLADEYHERTGTRLSIAGLQMRAKRMNDKDQVWGSIDDEALDGAMEYVRKNIFKIIAEKMEKFGSAHKWSPQTIRDQLTARYKAAESEASSPDTHALPALPPPPIIVSSAPPIPETPTYAQTYTTASMEHSFGPYLPSQPIMHGMIGYPSGFDGSHAAQSFPEFRRCISE